MRTKKVWNTHKRELIELTKKLNNAFRNKKRASKPNKYKRWTTNCVVYLVLPTCKKNRYRPRG